MKAKVDYMYHPGDVVRVREDLAENTNYKMCSGKNNGADCWIWGWMKEYAGKQITIKESMVMVFMRLPLPKIVFGLMKCLSL